MSGKCLKCFIAVISLFLTAQFLYPAEAKPSEEKAPKPIMTRGMSLSEYRKKYPVISPNELRKPDLQVNGFKIGYYNANQLLGIREKGAADFYYQHQSYARAIRYYESATLKIPDEAEVYYRLGEIYAYLQVYSMSAKYYKLALDKYPLPVNLGKPKKYQDLSRIRYAFYSFKSSENSEDSRPKDRAIAIEHELGKTMPEIKDTQPDVYDEYEKLHMLIYGQTSVIQK